MEESKDTKFLREYYEGLNKRYNDRADNLPCNEDTLHSALSIAYDTHKYVQSRDLTDEQFNVIKKKVYDKIRNCKCLCSKE